MTVPGPSPALRDEEPSSPEDARWTGPMAAEAFATDDAFQQEAVLAAAGTVS